MAGKRKKKAQSSQMVPAAMVMPPQMGPAKRKKKRKAKGPAAGVGSRALAEGTMRIHRTELVVSADKVGGKFFLTPDGFTWLKSMSKLFERYRFHSLLIEYRPLVGTQTAGAITFAVEWVIAGSPDKTKTRQVIASFTPCMDGPVWNAMNLRLPANQLQSRPWYSVQPGSDPLEGGPGTLWWQYNVPPATDSGEFWVTYDVTLQGTRA